jgi:type IX secretion system PorP/SprF family membrane protein
MIRSFILIVLVGGAFASQAQYFQFSQYNFTSQRISPTSPAESDYATLGLIFRNQGTGSDVNLNSNFLSAAYPIITRKGVRWSGIGVTVMDDRSGGIFSLQEATLSYAINVPMSRFETLTLGFKGLYQQKQADLSGLFTGSQFVPDRGFDE